MFVYDWEKKEAPPTYIPVCARLPRAHVTHNYLDIWGTALQKASSSIVSISLQSLIQLYRRVPRISWSWVNADFL